MTTYDPGLHTAGEGFLCLHRNENLFVSEQWLADLARTAVASSGISTYPDPVGLEVRGALADLYGIGPENVYLGNGADGVLADLLAWLRHRFDSVGVLDVGFKVYPLLARRFRYRLETIPGKTFRTGKIEPTDWKGLALVDSPNAITGARIDRGELLSMADSEGSFLIWDNVYGELAGDEPPDPMLDNVVVVRSFSKFYGLAGLRIGYCLASAPVVGELQELKDAFPVNGLAQRVALSVLDRRERLEEVAAETLRCRATLVERLRRLGFVIDHAPAAHFVLVRHPAIDAKTVQDAMQRRGILVRHFAGRPTDDYVRVTVPPAPAIERLSEALEELVHAAALPPDTAVTVNAGGEMPDNDGT